MADAPDSSFTRHVDKLPGSELRRLKAASQLLKPILKLGKQGITPAFLAALDQALADHELLKIKFDEFKDQRREVSRDLAAKTASQVILQVGHTLTLYRKRPGTDLEETRPATSD